MKRWILSGILIRNMQVKNMTLTDRPIPTLTGRDAERFIKAAEVAEKNPHTIALPVSDSDVEKILSKAKLNGAL